MVGVGDEGLHDDHAPLVTRDPAVAERFGFEKIEDPDGDDPEEYEDDEEDEGGGGIAAAQREMTCRIAGRMYERVRYGSEKGEWGADRQPCGDCGVAKGMLHVPGCDIGRRPSCCGQAMSCARPYEE